MQPGPPRNSPIQVQCGVCLDNIASTTYKTIDESPICDDCVRDEVVPLFHEAFKHEFKYPVTWGFGTVLEAGSFAAELGADFVKRLKQIEKEYHTPPSRRVYCKSLIYAEYAPPRGEPVVRGTRENKWLRTKPRSEKEVEEAIKDGRELVECGAMVWQWKKMISYGPRSVFLLPHCWTCNRAGICTQCGSVQRDQDQFEKHWCQRTPQNNAEEALKGMTRGKDYQICPNPKCKEVFALKDGCNFVRFANKSAVPGGFFACAVKDHSNIMTITGLWESRALASTNQGHAMRCMIGQGWDLFERNRNTRLIALPIDGASKHGR